MDGLLEPRLNPTTEKETSAARPILIGIILLGVVVGILALILRSEQPKPAAPPAYAVNLKFSDLQTSAAQNFAGATVSYLDGTVSNTGDKIVSHATVQVTFKDDIGQTAQREEVPIRVLP